VEPNINAVNHSRSTNNTSGITGVCLEGSKWRVRIQKCISLGYWKTKEDATAMRQYWECKLFKEFAPNKDIVMMTDEKVGEMMKSQPQVKAFQNCKFDAKQISVVFG
jgi:hypothetical protein